MLNKVHNVTGYGLFCFMGLTFKSYCCKINTSKNITFVRIGELILIGRMCKGYEKCQVSKVFYNTRGLHSSFFCFNLPYVWAADCKWTGLY